MKLNNYYCSNTNCSYKTDCNTEKESVNQLVIDGGFDQNKKTLCPTCKKDSLVFLVER